VALWHASGEWLPSQGEPVMPDMGTKKPANKNVAGQINFMLTAG
jgi:hypothetical protein